MVAQQLSTKSAAAIWARLEAACGPAVTAPRVLELDEVAFRTIGFSRQKTAYGRSLAEAVAGGVLDFDALATIPEDEAIAAISALRGFGRWSAEIYLLFALGRADISRRRSRAAGRHAEAQAAGRGRTARRWIS